MPQMAPLSWVILMTLFILIFLMFNSINYFMFKYQTKSQKFQINKKNINWKW